MNKPFIAIPMGDPAGIGPEILIKAMASKEVTDHAACVIIGNHDILEQAKGFPGMPEVTVRRIREPEEGCYEAGVLNVIHLDNIEIERLRIGAVSGMCGKAAYQYIERAIELAMQNQVAAVTTTPINKESLKAGEIPFIGHTEMFAALTRTPDPLTLFEVRNMRVFFLSRHVSLRQSCDLVTRERIVDYVKRCTGVLKRLGVEDGCMAVAGLNPHSGEHGLFGDEEVLHVCPAIEQLTAEGYRVAGPVGADSVFHLALEGRYNSVLSLYHDQGHIATKTLDFHRTISITGGMPILRTSVDHGTAFDVAGRGIASAVSLIEAIRIAVKYAPSFAAGG